MSGDRGAVTGQKKPTLARRSAIALISVMVAWCAWQSVTAYHSADAQAQRHVLALAKALSYQVDSSFRSIDDLLADAASRINPAVWPDPQLVSWFQSRLADFPEVRLMLVSGAQGKTMGAGLTAKGPIGNAIEVGDREQYRYHHDHPDDLKMRIDNPLISRLDGLPGIPLSRVVVAPDGRFLGTIVVTLDPNFLVKLLESIVIEDEGGAAVMRSDGVFLARVPSQDHTFGNSVAGGSLFRHFVPRAKDGVARYVAMVDGNQKIVGYRSVDSYPVVAWVGLTTQTAFADWRLDLYRWIAVLTAFSAALFALAWLSDHREHYRSLLAAELERNNRDLAHLVDDRTRHLRLAREEAESRARALASSNAELERFAYIASHDLQEPLRTVTSYVQLLERRYGDKLGGDAREFIQFAVSGTHRMHNLIKAILAYSRISTQGEPFAPTRLDDALSDALINLRAIIDDNGVVIGRDALPELCVDGAQMVSLFQNLIGNAIKYRRADVAPVIHVGVRRGEGEWVFTVEDNGIGIAMEHWEKIFIIFHRLQRSESQEGTGIGLAICKKIVERHRGRIWLESTPGLGSIFYFSLPAETAEVGA